MGQRNVVTSSFFCSRPLWGELLDGVASGLTEAATKKQKLCGTAQSLSTFPPATNARFLPSIPTLSVPLAGCQGCCTRSSRLGYDGVRHHRANQLRAAICSCSVRSFPQLAIWSARPHERPGHRRVRGPRRRPMLVAAPVFCDSQCDRGPRGLQAAAKRRSWPRSSPRSVSLHLHERRRVLDGTYDLNFPELIPPKTDPGLVGRDHLPTRHGGGHHAPVMVALTLFVRYTPLGKAMRATAQNPTAARSWASTWTA